MSQSQRKRILFFAEAVTLAHVARPLVLAQSLDPAQYEVHFACAPRFEFAFAKTNFRRWDIDSISCEQFLRALAHGSRLYDFATLQKYVDEDLSVIGEVQPDLIVGDFRLSLAVSAAVTKVKYAAIANAYWSPYTKRKLFPLPDVPASRVLGYRLTSALFHLFQPLIFAYHARPLNKLQRKYGLRPLGNLLRVYTYGDYTLYADPPDFYPTSSLPLNHRFLGPIDWSPDTELPPWWNELPADEAIIYVNLGSSGAARLLPRIIQVLSELPITAVVATAGRWRPVELPANVKVCDYIPGREAVSKACLVICNGGSPSVYQALAQGVPIIGITSNMDQCLSMDPVELAQAGVVIPASQTSARSLAKTITAISNQGSFRDNARALQQKLISLNSTQAFDSFVGGLLKPARVT